MGVSSSGAGIPAARARPAGARAAAGAVYVPFGGGVVCTRSGPSGNARSSSLKMSLFRLAACLLAVAAAWPARAVNPAILPGLVGATELIASDARSGMALSGYDPVSYLLEGAARPGLAAHEAVYGGLAWRFGSAANRAAFLRDPAAFLPAAGGYDAEAASAGRVAAADPLLFAARAGRLYLFRTAEGRRRFLADDGAAAAAEAGWRRISSGLVRG